MQSLLSSLQSTHDHTQVGQVEVAQVKIVLQHLPFSKDYFPQLFRLSLVECELTSLHGLPKLPQLLSLDLSANLLSGPADLMPLNSQCPALIDLNLLRNKVDSTGTIHQLAVFCPRLKILNLTSNKVTDLFLDTMHYQQFVVDLFPSLYYLDCLEVRQPQPPQLTRKRVTRNQNRKQFIFYWHHEAQTARLTYIMIMDPLYDKARFTFLRGLAQCYLDQTTQHQQAYFGIDHHRMEVMAQQMHTQNYLDAYLAKDYQQAGRQGRKHFMRVYQQHLGVTANTNYSYPYVEDGKVKVQPREKRGQADQQEMIDRFLQEGYQSQSQYPLVYKEYMKNMVIIGLFLFKFLEVIDRYNG